MDDRHSPVLALLEKLVDEVADPFPVLFLGDFSVEPVEQLVVGDHPDSLGFCVSELESPHLDCLLLVEVEFLDECDFKLLLDYLGLGKVILREITVTLGLVFLNAGT